MFKGDEFDYALGDSPFIKHRPGEENDPDLMTHVYAVGRVNGSQLPVIEVWTVGKVKKHRDKYNKQGGKHYSFRDWEMYARKIPLLQVLKYMPKSIELSNAIALSNAADQGQHAVIDGDFVTVTDPDTGDVRGQVDQETGEIMQNNSPLRSYSEMLTLIQRCDNADALDLLADEVRDFPDAERVKLDQAFMDRREILLGA